MNFSWQKISKILVIFFTVNCAIADVSENNLRQGDIVFIRSKSSQSKALEEVTQSIWTHMGIALRVDSSTNPKKIVDYSEAGEWVVVHSGGPVRFNTYKEFLAMGSSSAVKRLRSGVDLSKAEAAFKKALPYVKKQTSYDIYFLDEPKYCSGFVNLVAKAAFGIELAQPVSINSLNLDGPEAKKIIQQRFAPKVAPMSFEKWKTKETITPVSIFNSSLLIPVR